MISNSAEYKKLHTAYAIEIDSAARTGSGIAAHNATMIYCQIMNLWGKNISHGEAQRRVFKRINHRFVYLYKTGNS